MDKMTKQQRSYCMSQVKGGNTKLEIDFRKYIWNKGIRGYRLHSKLPGKPDLFFGTKKVAVFIDGCFWHKCPVCYKGPKTNKKFWNDKIKKNVERDLAVDISMADMGIKVLRLWGHEIKLNIDSCYKRLNKILTGKQMFTKIRK